MQSTSSLIGDTLIVIVLYNRELIESESFLTLKSTINQFEDTNECINLLVVNNGPNSITYKTDYDRLNAFFIERLDNPGVSTAYNLGYDLAMQLNKSWLLLLDQDTSLPGVFWPHYFASINNHPRLPVHAPKLKARGVLVSPCGYKFYRGYILPEITTGTFQTKGHNVLNSGLLISTEAFGQVGGYDESVGLYFSDFVFFDRIKKVFPSFAVVDVELSHDLTSSDYSDPYMAQKSFLMYCQGAKAASSNKIIKSFLYILTVGARSLVMSLRLKSLTYIKIFLRSWVID